MNKPGPKLTPRPVEFTREFYVEQKAAKVRDAQLAKIFFTNVDVIYRWKREIGIDRKEARRLAGQMRQGMKYRKFGKV